MPRRRDRRHGDDGARDEQPGGPYIEGEDVGDDPARQDDDEAAADLDEPEDMTADLESQAADYLADNDLWMYGQNAEAVLEVLDRLDEMDAVEAQALALAWRESAKTPRELARKATRKLVEGDEETGRHLQMAREAVGTWLAVTAEYPAFVRAVPDWAKLCAQVSEAAMDVLTALILDESLDETNCAILAAPWSDVIGDPTAVDEEEEDEEEEEIAGDLEEEDEDDEELAEGEFGPNSEAVADFLNRLWLLTPEQVARLVASWENASRDSLSYAHACLHTVVAEDPEWRDQVRKAQERLTPWLNGGRLEETAGFLGQAGQAELRKKAGPALADAIAALVVGDLLEAEDAQVLYGPWFNLVGAPPLLVGHHDTSEKED
jgi:hypothetical protein